MYKHTPGPWKDFQTDFGDGRRLAIGVHTTQGNQSDVAHCHGFNSDRTDEEVEANARLIAAAPDLLLDLQAASETLRRYETAHRAKGTDDSLAKAEVNQVLAERFELTILQATQVPAVADVSS